MDHHQHHDLVSWIEGVKASTEESRVVFDVVVGQRLTRFAAVAEAVAAELLMRDRLRAGGDAATMERLRTWYVVAARRLLQAQNGVSIRIVASASAPSPKPPPAGAGAAESTWRRPVGIYTALGGFLAAFQHVVQRHVFQGRPVDLSSGLILAAYVAVGLIGVRWFLDPRETRVEAGTG